MKTELEIKQKIYIYHNELMNNESLTREEANILKSIIKELEWVLGKDRGEQE